MTFKSFSSSGANEQQSGYTSLGLYDEMSFGKYKGRTIEFLIENKTDYIMWCIDNIKTFQLNNEAYTFYTQKTEGIDIYDDIIKEEPQNKKKKSKYNMDEVWNFENEDTNYDGTF